jgi:hypothetical protein
MSRSSSTIAPSVVMIGAALVLTSCSSNAAGTVSAAQCLGASFVEKNLSRVRKSAGRHRGLVDRPGFRFP